MPPNPLAQTFAPSLPATAAGTGSEPIEAANMPPNKASAFPSLPVLSTFLLSHFAQLSPMAAAAEVPWLYHSPIPPRPIMSPIPGQEQTQPGVRPKLGPPRPLPANSGVKKLVLSITPTEGVYAALGASPLPPPLDHPSIEGIMHTAPAKATVPDGSKPPASNRGKLTTAAFLHRPWKLTRGRLPRGTTVWSSHKAFDESLTTGYNLALIERLGADVENAKVLVGYKGDEGRRIGLVAGFGADGSQGLEIDDVKGRIVIEFGDLRNEGEWFGFDDATENEKKISNDEETGHDRPRGNGKITSIACMNAFHPAEVDRVAAAAVEAGFATSVEDCSGLVYLTGAVREEGLQAALQKGMKVVCVGYRLCEVWGIGCLAEKVKERWPDVDVQVVDEEEELPPPREKKVVKAAPRSGKQTGKKTEQSDSGEAKGTQVSKKRRTGSVENEEDGGVML